MRETRMYTETHNMYDALEKAVASLDSGFPYGRDWQDVALMLYRRAFILCDAARGCGTCPLAFTCGPDKSYEFFNIIRTLILRIDMILKNVLNPSLNALSHCAQASEHLNAIMNELLAWFYNDKPDGQNPEPQKGISSEDQEAADGLEALFGSDNGAAMGTSQASPRVNAQGFDSSEDGDPHPEDVDTEEPDYGEHDNDDGTGNDEDPDDDSDDEEDEEEEEGHDTDTEAGARPRETPAPPANPAPRRRRPEVFCSDERDDDSGPPIDSES